MTLNLFDIYFYSGDRDGLYDHLDGLILTYASQPLFLTGLISEIVESILTIEAWDLLARLLKICRQLNLCLPPYDQFRVLQLSARSHAFKVLSQCFDDYEHLLILLEGAKRHSLTITCYELGGLGDYIEAICILKRLIDEILPCLKVNIRIPTDLSDSLERLVGTDSISFTRCEWHERRISGSIHLLTLTAIARCVYNLTPTSLVRPQQSNIAAYCDAISDSLLPDSFLDHDYIIWNSQSQPKLQPYKLRRSYFHRSVHYRHWQQCISSFLPNNNVIDIGEYPISWGSFPRHKNYIHRPAKSMSFEALIGLCINANKIISIDSMLVHLCAAIGKSCDLWLAIGHEQRWFLDYGMQPSMYTEHCTLYKQASLHQWDAMIPQASLTPISLL